MTEIEEIQETRVGTFCCKIEKRCMCGGLNLGNQEKKTLKRFKKFGLDSQ